MTENYGNVEVVVGSGECCKRFFDSENIGSYLAVGSTFTSPLVSLMPFGFGIQVVSSAFISNNEIGYSSVRLKVFSIWLPISSFGWVPSHSDQQRLDRSYLLGTKIRIQNVLSWLRCCCDYTLAKTSKFAYLSYVVFPALAKHDISWASSR